MCTYANFFLPYFSRPFCRFSIFVFLAFSFVFSTLSRKWRRTLFVRELRHLFLRYSVHLVKEIVKLLKKSERWKNKWSKVKTLPDKPRSRWPVFLQTVWKMLSKKAVSICVIIQQDCKVKRWLMWLSIIILKKKKNVKWRKNRNELWNTLYMAQMSDTRTPNY